MGNLEKSSLTKKVIKSLDDGWRLAWSYYSFYYLDLLQLGAEFVGTFILIFGATAAPIVNQKYYSGSVVESTLIGNAVCAGLAVMIVVISTGHISGAHLNPSITIAFATLRKFPWVQVPAYIAVQVIASISASYVLKLVYHPFLSGGLTVPNVSIPQAFFIEFIITFNLLFVVTAVATDTETIGNLGGIAIGATVMLNIFIAGYVYKSINCQITCMYVF